MSFGELGKSPQAAKPTQVNYNDVANAYATQMAASASYGGQSSTVKTSGQGVPTPAPIESKPVLGT